MSFQSLRDEVLAKIEEEKRLNSANPFAKYQAQMESLNKPIDELNKQQPKYTRPEEYNKYLALSQSNAGKSEMEAGLTGAESQMQQYMNLAKTKAGTTTLPGQGQLERNIQRATQGAITNTKDMTQSPMASLGALQDIYGKQMGAYNDLALQQAQYYDKNQSELMGAIQQNTNFQTQAGQMRSQYAQGQQGVQMGALQTGMGLSDQEFEYNVNQPFQRKYNQLNANNQTMMGMYQMDRNEALQRELAQQQNDAASSSNMFGLIGTLGGAALGGPIGGAVGGAIGAGLGSLFRGSTGK